MRHFVIFLLLTAFHTVAHATAPCWVDKGAPPMFGSSEQGEALKGVAGTSCEIVGFAWRFDQSKQGGVGTRYSFLLWSPSGQRLVRVHTHSVTGTDWETWAGVSPTAVKAEDVSDGLDFKSYKNGHGRAPLSDAERAFVKAQDTKGRYKAAL